MLSSFRPEIPPGELPLSTQIALGPARGSDVAIPEVIGVYRGFGV